MSCNGCRVLRKGCSDTCILRPCLQWIDTAEAQGHATVFVAKFFGRAGLMGLISAVPENQRSALFQSLLYEACGRTVNPVFGAVGLLWSGNWQMCQAAVDTVLKGCSLRPPSPSSVLPPNLSYSSACPPMSGKLTDVRVEDPTQMTFPSTASAAVSLGIGLPEPTAQEPNSNGWTLEPNQLQCANTTELRREMQLPRRVRPRVDEECDHLELDLTLKVKGEKKKKKTAGAKRLSSPCDSVNSEGSVTCLGSAVQEPLGTSVIPQPHRQLLPLLQ